ncbi:MAG TPA: GNAT family N-acetyltransferase [Candidatus Limnocylindrales bacterium]|nr:GNAT family N-acetyltransferase [Candidatus Limnocylindrales bacterium]
MGCLALDRSREAARAGVGLSGAGERPAFDVRAARPEDADAMTALEHASAIHHAAIDPDRWRVPSLEAVARNRRHWLRVRPRSEGFVAVADGQVVGMIELWLKRPHDSTGGGARIQRLRADLGISVAPGWQGRGVGSALMLAGEAWARAQGAERMVLDLAANNTGAQRLYERLGYEVEAIAMDKAIEPDPSAVDPPDRVRNADGEVVPTIVGDLVTLRPIRLEDREALLEVLRDPSVVAIWDTSGPEHSVDELLAGDAGFTVWAIDVDGEFAGSIQASEEGDQDYRRAGIDIFMSSRFQGRGLGTDAVRTLARYLLEVRGHHRLTIDPAASNARAIRTYAKVGFKPVGVMRQYERGRDGKYHDGLLMDLLAGELT